VLARCSGDRPPGGGPVFRALGRSRIVSNTVRPCDADRRLGMQRDRAGCMWERLQLARSGRRHHSG
jgi:hypothetical protein